MHKNAHQYGNKYISIIRFNAISCRIERNFTHLYYPDNNTYLNNDKRLLFNTLIDNSNLSKLENTLQTEMPASLSSALLYSGSALPSNFSKPVLHPPLTFHAHLTIMFACLQAHHHDIMSEFNG